MLSEIERFVNWARRRNPEARTYKDYRYDLAQFAAVLGHKSVQDVSVQDIDQFIHVQLLRGLQPNTINRRLAAITSFYIFLQAENESLDCPVIPRRHKLRTPQALPRPVKREDLRRFFSVIESIRDRAMFLLMLRPDFRDDSDVDVLVSFHEDAPWSLFDLIRMEDELAELFGRPVDLVEKEGLRNPYRRKHILDSREVLYATHCA